MVICPALPCPAPLYASTDQRLLPPPSFLLKGSLMLQLQY